MQLMKRALEEQHSGYPATDKGRQGDKVVTFPRSKPESAAPAKLKPGLY